MRVVFLLDLNGNADPISISISTFSICMLPHWPRSSEKPPSLALDKGPAHCLPTSPAMSHQPRAYWSNAHQVPGTHQILPFLGHQRQEIMVCLQCVLLSLPLHSHTFSGSLRRPVHLIRRMMPRHQWFNLQLLQTLPRSWTKAILWTTSRPMHPLITSPVYYWIQSHLQVSWRRSEMLCYATSMSGVGRLVFEGKNSTCLRCGACAWGRVDSTESAFLLNSIPLLIFSLHTAWSTH
jgi:hypothetical protein